MAADSSTDDDDAQVTRSVDISAPIDDVWEAVADPEQRAEWLSDPDARQRELHIDRVEPNRHLSWTWWSPVDTEQTGVAQPHPPGEVEIELEPLDAHGTRVTVTERRLASATQFTARACADLTATAQSDAGYPLHRWDRRLFHLELLYIPVGAHVA